MKTIYLNPLYLFGYAFLAAISLYSLKLSGLYKNGDETLTLVIFIMCIMAIFLGVVFDSFFSKQIKLDIADNYINKVLWPNALFIIVGFIIDCAASGVIPLLSVIQGADYDYKDFGLKTFHVFYMGYMSAFSIVCFERYLATKNKKFFWYSMFGIVVTVFIVSRGAMLLLLIPMALLFLSQKRDRNKGGIKKTALIIMSVLIAILVFGYIGDKRMLASGYKDDNAIMNIGQANDLFSNIPSGFFWVYLYTSSPYGTLAAQQGFDNTDRSDIETFIEGAVLPDFISKYVAPTVSTVFQPLRLTPELTVGTGFSVALVTLGFTGVILLFLWIIFMSFSFAWLNRNRYINSTCAILSAAAILMTFDNMFIFSSCVMQLIIITLFSRFRLSKYYLI